MLGATSVYVRLPLTFVRGILPMTIDKNLEFSIIGGAQALPPFGLFVVP